MTLHERSIHTASFTENLKLQEKLTLEDALWMNCNKFKKLESGHYKF